MDSKRAKTARGRRALREMAPKLNENPRTTLVMRGQKSSEIVNNALTDLYLLKKPRAKHFTRHNAVHPFEDPTPLEFLCQKNDASLFAFGTHQKKRPHNLLLGRLFDHHIMDMFEFGIESYKGIAAFASETSGGSSTDVKPCMLFSGAEWEHDPTLGYLRTLLVDFFHGDVVEHLDPLGIEQLLCFTARPNGKVHMRCYCARLLKSAEGKSPYVSLQEMGPSLDLAMRRSQQAAPDVMKQAMTHPKASESKPKKVKNIERSKLLGKQGRLHVPRQDLGQLTTARFKAMRKPKRPADGGDGGDGGGVSAEGGSSASKKARA